MLCRSLKIQKKRRVFSLLFSTLFLYANAHADSGVVASELPELNSEEKIEGLKYSVANRWRLGLHALSLSANRFVNSYGPKLELQYYISEKLSVSGAYSKIFNAASSDVELIQSIGANPSLRNPSSIISGKIGWHPYYGKIFGLSGLHHFRLNLGVGLQALSVDSLQESLQDSQQIIAPALSAGITTYIGSSYSIDVGAEFSTYSIQANESAISRSQWIYSLGVGALL